MRILLVEFRDPLHPEAGGAESLLIEVFSRLAAAGHEIDYLCCRPPGAPRHAKIRGVEIHRAGPQLVFNYVAPAAARRLLAQRSHDVIVEGLDKIPFFLPLFQRRAPVVGHVPHLFGDTIFLEAAWPIAAYVWLMERPVPRVYRRCRFSALSEATRQDLVRRGVAAERIRVIPPGIDRDLHRPAAARADGGAPTILYVGRLKRYKGIETVLEATALLRRTVPNVRCSIVGVGDHAEALRRRAANFGLGGHVEFAGRVTLAEKVRRMQQADVLVYPSPKEGWGLSVIEANACGTPVVASRSPGLTEAVADGESGLLVPHGDAAAMAAALQRILTDRDLAASLRQGAARWAQRFTWESSAQAMGQLLEDARDEWRRPSSR